MLEVISESLHFHNLKERTIGEKLGVRSSFSFIHWLSEPVSSSPLAIFRILFGLALVLSCVRFLWLGWLNEQYIAPVFHFTYFGFSWVKPFPVPILYSLYGLMTLAAGCIMLGYYYRISATVFFILFNYFELLDKAYYLNHYYFVSLISFLLIVIPMNSRLSIDSTLSPKIFRSHLPRWNLILVQFQIACVYFFAGIAKMNSDWLFEALPLRIWLPAHTDFPILGTLFSYPETAYLFSWAGMLFDISIIPFLYWHRTQFLAYAAVVIFHVITGILFPIGVFPLVMILSTPLFFHHKFHDAVVRLIESKIPSGISTTEINPNQSQSFSTIAQFFLFSYIIIQILIPLRCFLYSGNLYWTENGYRFSWRVMLMEKSGEATFYVKDSASGREGIVNNRDFLNATQEKQMSFQPDMILEFAHFLKEYYERQGMKNPEVRAEVYVTLNGRPSSLFIDSTINLAKEQESFFEKKWVLAYPY